MPIVAARLVGVRASVPSRSTAVDGTGFGLSVRRWAGEACLRKTKQKCVILAFQKIEPPARDGDSGDYSVGSGEVVPSGSTRKRQARVAGWPSGRHVTIHCW